VNKYEYEINRHALSEVPDFERPFVDAHKHRRVVRRPAQTWHRFLSISHTICYHHLFPQYRTHRADIIYGAEKMVQNTQRLVASAFTTAL